MCLCCLCFCEKREINHHRRQKTRSNLDHRRPFQQQCPRLSSDFTYQSTNDVDTVEKVSTCSGSAHEARQRGCDPSGYVFAFPPLYVTIDTVQSSDYRETMSLLRPKPIQYHGDKSRISHRADFGRLRDDFRPGHRMPGQDSLPMTASDGQYQLVRGRLNETWTTLTSVWRSKRDAWVWEEGEGRSGVRLPYCFRATRSHSCAFEGVHQLSCDMSQWGNRH